MCLNLLRELSESPLPCTRADPALIDRLRLLDAAGLIKVLIPPPHLGCGDGLRRDPASVLKITSRGWEALRTQVVEDEAPSLPMRPARSRSGSASLERVRLAAWLGRSSRHPGHPDTDG